MLEEKIEVLYNTIQERKHQWSEYVKLFGEDHCLTKGVFETIWGLEEAFKLISGRSYTSVLLEKMEAMRASMGGMY